MNSSSVSLGDLSDEILLMIFRKLTNVDILYSFYGVNKRFTRIVRDRVFTRHLTFGQQCGKVLHQDFTSNRMINRLCSQVLPSISNKIIRIDLHSSSIKAIFSAAHYPCLTELSLHHFTEDLARSLFLDEHLSSDIFKQRIRLVEVTNNSMEETDEEEHIDSPMQYVCEQIFLHLPLLDTLSFNVTSSSIDPLEICIADLRPTDRFGSSTLTTLKISLESFQDLLYCLDGRFSQLREVDVIINNLHQSSFFANEGDLPRLKSLSICNEHSGANFEETILPLLCRMSNLESLRLCLKVYSFSTVIDPRYMSTYLLPCVPQLKQFHFFIHSKLLALADQSNLSQMKNMKQILFRSADNILSAYGDYFPTKNEAHYILYSSPCFGEFFSGITNRFPGGRFDHVRRVSVIDEEAFDHEFFVRLHQSFPSMEELSITNNSEQHRRSIEQSNVVHQHLSPIRYIHLHFISLVNAHDDYLEQFLIHAKAILACKVTLFVNYHSVRRLIQNFSSDQIRINANQVKKLYLSDGFESSDLLRDYFPHAQISVKSYLRYLNED